MTKPELGKRPTLPIRVPPAALGALNHELRWQIIAYLRLSDLRVSELSELLGSELNSVSYHLRKLRTAGLVDVRRSDNDARDNYYQIKTKALQKLILDMEHAFFLGRRGAETPAETTDASAIANPSNPANPAANPGRLSGLRALVLCTHNTARSQMVEGFLRALSHHELDVTSAGTQPTSIHPQAIAAMQAYDIDISQQTLTAVDTLVGKHFDIVVTVCDRAREKCPSFPAVKLQLHWSVADPTNAPAAEQPTVFAETARELERRVKNLLAVIRVRLL